MKTEKPIVFFDLETTGTDTNKDRIVELSVVKVQNGDVIKKHHFYINPQINIPKEASDVHGITNEKVEGCPVFSEIAFMLHDFLTGCDLAGYNSDRFDIPLLQNEFSRVGIVFPEEDTNTIDMYKIEQIINSHKLDATYKRYTGNDLNDAHTAEADTFATIEILGHQLVVLQEMNDGVELDAKAIQDLCMGEKERVDFGGQLYRKDGSVYFNFGKNKDKKVTDDIRYAEWCLSANFSKDFKDNLLKALNPENK